MVHIDKIKNYLPNRYYHPIRVLQIISLGEYPIFIRNKEKLNRIESFLVRVIGSCPLYRRILALVSIRISFELPILSSPPNLPRLQKRLYYAN